MKKEQILEVSYKGGHSMAFDKQIEKAAGRSRDASGFCFIDGSRDVTFWYVRRDAAERAGARVKAALGRKVKVRVVYYGGPA